MPSPVESAPSDFAFPQSKASFGAPALSGFDPHMLEGSQTAMLQIRRDAAFGSGVQTSLKLLPPAMADLAVRHPVSLEPRV